jgi:hypothetical protein
LKAPFDNYLSLSAELFFFLPPGWALASTIKAFATEIAEAFTVNKNTQLIETTGACEPALWRISDSKSGLAIYDSPARAAVRARMTSDSFIACTGVASS